MSTRTERKLAGATNMQLLDMLLAPDVSRDKAQLIRAEILRRLYRVERLKLQELQQEERQ